MRSLLKLSRTLLCIPQPKVTREEATQIAKEAAAAKDWHWEEPVQVTEDLRCWRFFTALWMRGGNVAVQIDNQDGHVRHISIVKH